MFSLSLVFRSPQRLCGGCIGCIDGMHVEGFEEYARDIRTVLLAASRH